MNKGSVSNILRKLGLLYPLDKLRYQLEKNRNKKDNQAFKSSHPNVALPPDYMMYESFQLNYSKYFSGGKESAAWVVELLRKHIDLNQTNLLDWGCGPGRIVRHMPELLGNRNGYFGTDYNANSIRWCSENIPLVTFNHNSLEAELPYSDNKFDAIYGISIFTHLSEKMHFNWYAELRRVLKPGGILLVTTQGNQFKSKMTPSEIAEFEKGSLVIRGNVKEGHRTYSAFHPDQFIKLLFHQDKIEEKIVIDAEGKNYIPQDTWIVRKN